MSAQWKTEHRKLTQAELTAEARTRFGDDARTWRFRCPMCGDEASAQDFIDADADPNHIGQECIGRSLGACSNRAVRGRDGIRRPRGEKGKPGRGCDWAAYGLFHGPWEIVLPAEGDRPERSAWSFPLAAGGAS